MPKLQIFELKLTMVSEPDQWRIDSLTPLSADAYPGLETRGRRSYEPVSQVLRRPHKSGRPTSRSIRRGSTTTPHSGRRFAELPRTISASSIARP